MDSALAMLEYKTVASGLMALDILTKTADVDILDARVVCPGKYMVLFCGELGAVKASLDAARAAHAQNEIDCFVLGNPAAGVAEMLRGEKKDPSGALGLVETYSGAAAVLAADTAAKAAKITLVEIRLSTGMCGKSYAMFTGPLSAVEAALNAAKKTASGRGMLLDTALIPNPDAKMRTALTEVNHATFPSI